jgi:hypothetical protein
MGRRFPGAPLGLRDRGCRWLAAALVAVFIIVTRNGAAEQAGRTANAFRATLGWIAAVWDVASVRR